MLNSVLIYNGTSFLFLFCPRKIPSAFRSIIRCFELATTTTPICFIKPPLSNKQQRLSPQVTNESSGILNLGVNGILEAARPYTLDAQPPHWGKVFDIAAERYASDLRINLNSGQESCSVIK